MICPCGSGRALDRCCGPLHEGARAPTAEALMRSRYSAFVLGRIDYLLESHHPDTRDSIERAGVERWSRDSEWLGLTIVESGEEVVEFEARYRNRGIEAVHRERSRFRMHQGRWHYLDGTTPPARRAATAGRNDPCPCGSGKKFKKCCGR